MFKVGDRVEVVNPAHGWYGEITTIESALRPSNGGPKCVLAPAGTPVHTLGFTPPPDSSAVIAKPSDLRKIDDDDDHASWDEIEKLTQ